MKKTILLIVSCFLFYYSSLSQQYRLVSPKPDYVAADGNVTFKWSVVDSAISYEIIVAKDTSFNNPSYNPNSILGTSTQTTLAVGFTYYWKIRATTLHGGVQDWSYYRTLYIFAPNQFAGLKLWFDAGKNITPSMTNNTPVDQWTDLSSTPVAASQATAANKPIYKTGISQLCNKPVVHFNGTGTPSYLNFTGVGLNDQNQGFTTLMVRNFAVNNNPYQYLQYVLGGAPFNGFVSEANYYTGATGWGAYTKVGGSYDGILATTAADLTTNFSIYTYQRTKLYRNGVAPLLGFSNLAAHNNVNNPFFINAIGTCPGAPGIFSYKGDIAEMIVYDGDLDTTSRKLAEQYLRYKYAPPVDLGGDSIFNKFCANATINAGGCFSSYLWSTGATTASINATSLGTYWVRATDIFGYTSTDTIRLRPQIPFNQLPKNNFLCAGDSIVWNTGYPSSGFQFTWSTGANTAAISIKNAGSYYVKIKDAFNCYFYSDTIHVAVDLFPNHSLGPDTSFCSGNRLNFIYPNPLNSIVWSNGDTTNETIINTPGDYSALAVDSNGCVSKDTIHVYIKGVAPNINFANPILCATDTVLFLGDSTPPAGNAIVLWIWNFGSSPLDSLRNVSHVFSSNGVYPVSLTAYTDSGCLNTISKNVSVYLKPQTNFQSKVSCALAPTQFTDLSLSSTTILLWKWHFANLDSSVIKNPKFTFTTQGKYEVDLKTTNSDGCSSFKSDSIEVFAPLSANFNFQNVCLGDSTLFKDITASLSIVSWIWNTGDNYFSIKKNFNHKYVTAGDKNVTLQVQNAIGCVDSVSKTVTVYKSPVAAFGDLITCEKQYYTPLDSSTFFEATNNWKWNIAGANYTGQSPQYFFTDTGSYNVKLIVTSVSECKDSISHLVHVTPNPKAAFTFTPLYGDAPLNVNFSNQSINANSYWWDFGDASSDIAINPSHIYSANNTFQIKLVATSEFGCQDSLTKSINVVHTDLDISVDEVITDELPLNDGTVLVTVAGRLSNVGTRLITTVKLYATIGSGGVISEDWDTLIQTGTSKYYPFTAHFVVAAANANSYVCVEAKSVNNGETETTLDNNRQCSSLNGVLQLIGPSPNPARGSAYLGLILPKAGKVTIDIVDLLGRIVMPEEELDLPTGRTDYNLPIKLLRVGEYFIRVKHNDDKLLQKLVVH